MPAVAAAARRAVPALAAAACLAALAACGAGHSALTGKVDGKGFAIQSSAFTQVTLAALGADPNDANSAGSDTPLGLLVLSESANICGDAGQAALAANKNYLVVLFAKVNSATGTFAGPGTGTYGALSLDGSSSTSGGSSDTSAAFAAAVTGGIAEGYVLANDASCQNSLAEGSFTTSGGTFKVDSYSGHSGGHMAGEIDFKIGSQNDSLKGTFNAAWCDSLGKLMQDPNGAAPACK